MSSEAIEGSSLLAFTGVVPIIVPALSLEYHLAEKLHAYTRIYSDGRGSSRPKDLVDIALISSESKFNAGPILDAARTTFEA